MTTASPNPEQTPPARPASRGDLETVLSVLRRRAILIVACCITVAVVAFVVSELQEKEYSASASLLFRNPGFAEELFGTSSGTANSDPTREAATNEKLVGLKIVAIRTANHLGDVTPDEVSEMVSVHSVGEAELVAVTATSADPHEAQLVANTFARQFISFRASTDKAKLVQAKSLAEREFNRLSPAAQDGPRGQALSRGAEKLGILASLQTGNAELVQPAGLPTSPSSPKPLRNAIIGAVIGLLLGIGLAFLLERLNRRLREPEEVQEAFELPLLATIPESNAIVTSNEGDAAPALPFLENESFRMLRGSLRYFSIDNDMRSVLVTSYVAGVGKSTVAWHLARVTATSAKTVIVETDLRDPSLSRQHGLARGPGLAEILTHQVELDDAIQEKVVARGGVAVSAGAGNSGEATSLSVITSGALPPNPAELIESKAMVDTLAELCRRYDLVVIDTAPVGVVADAFPLLDLADGVIAVARIDKTTRDSAAGLREQLNRLGANVLGVVANAVPKRRGRQKYGYGYYGGYYGANASAEEGTPAEPRA